MSTPDEKLKRSKRRHRRRVKVQSVKGILRHQYIHSNAPFRHDDDYAIAAAKLADHLACCSCSDCANPRRFYRGKRKSMQTLQERKWTEGNKT